MKRWGTALLKGIFVALACGMFYFTDASITVGGIGVMYQYLFAMAIIMLGFFVFLIVPDVRRILVVARYGWALSASYLWIVLYSLLVWAMLRSQLNVISRGCSYVIYALLGVLTAMVIVYMFGKDGPRLLVIGVVLANMMHVVQSIRENGAAVFFREYVDLLVTFTEKTGPVMKSFENLNYAYVLGFFMLYHLLEQVFNHRLRKQGLPRESHLSRDWGLFLIVVPCFLLGLKRSVLLGIIVGFVLALLFLWMSLRNTRMIAKVLCVGMMAFGFAYVIGCYYGVMDLLEKLGVNTMGRALFFQQLRPYYEMGIGYFGKGAGFVSRMMQEGLLIEGSRGYVPLDIHNEHLRQYIDLGFIGYLVWLFLFVYYKINYFFRDAESEGARLHGVMALIFTVVYYMTFMTENTLYAYMMSLIISLQMMSYYFDEYMGERYGT